MESKIKLRTVVRRHFSKSGNELESLINASKLDKNKSQEAEACFKVVKEQHDRLCALNQEIEEMIVSREGWDEDELDKECESTLKYQTRWAYLRTCFDSIHSAKSEPASSHGEKKLFKLPVLEMKKFDGNIKNWLTFWGQFKKVDADAGIVDTDKLQYLIQSMEIGTDVRSFVESFPLAKDSYKLCLNELKSRYAREELLIQTYVRELLSLILQKDRKDLTTLYDSINSHLRSLEVLGVTKDKFAAFLLPIVESALPTDTLTAWERSKPAKIDDELNCLLAFLKKEVESMQRIHMAATFKIEPRSIVDQEPTASCLASNTNSAPRILKCIWCEKGHASTECFKLIKMSIEERREFLKKKKACALCLKPGHHARFCKSHIKCYVCHQRHSPVLCTGIKKESTNTVSETIQNHSSEDRGSEQKVTLLQTLMVQIYNGEKYENVRALLDSGSQRSYVKEDLAKKLGLKPIGIENLSHSLFGGTKISLQNYNLYSLKVFSLDKAFEINIQALAQKTICKNVPRVNNSFSDLLSRNQIMLTDKQGNDFDISLLIGADYLGFLYTNSFVQLENGLTAVKTCLGWTLQGKTREAFVYNNNVISSFCSSQNIADFWNIEFLGIRDPVEVQSKQQREEEVLLSFNESIKMNDERRYEVQLPFKTGHDDLLSNRDRALCRLKSATKKLLTDKRFTDYDKVFKDWDELGIIERVPDSEKISNNLTHFLPHRPVYKESSLTTKIRPVFDASAKDQKGKSLNSCLEKGVNFLDKIPDLLNGFRKGRIGVTADIEKAFLQISICPENRDYLRFLWWNDETRQEVMEYRHCRVVFGLTSSPFLLSATIMYHLHTVSGKNKNTADLMSKSFYVDNLVTSLDSEADTKTFIEEAKAVMGEAMFNLRQWVTSPLRINDTGEQILSVLGLLWDTETDELYCNLKFLPQYSQSKEITKRELLSLIQKIFDPLGILSPVTLVPRLILQRVWSKKLAWDDKIPDDIITNFNNWYAKLQLLGHCRLPRRLSSEILSHCIVSLHMFCDASKDGYAACVFLRAEDSQGNTSVRLVSAKSRVTPPGKTTIPRLELLAALIGSRLVLAARESLQLANVVEYCWSDSGVTLCWIKRELPWNTFVGNRIKEIRQNTNINNWYHIAGSENWADLASRGCDAGQLLECRWWEGPPWLLQPPELWPRSALVIDEKQVEAELKKSACVNVVFVNNFSLKCCYFSKYTKILRMTAWIFRFAYNVRNNCKRKGELTYEECEHAESKLFFIIQAENKELLSKQTEKLITFYDKDNLLRIKTKLLLSDFPQNMKTPVVLPAGNTIVQRMVEQRHYHMQHAGTNMMIADLRKRTWIVGIRRLVKSIINKCIICKRHRAKPTIVSTAPLPTERLLPAAPFEVSGVDLAGPIYLTDGGKSWIVVFTCAVYRAVHLELTRSLSTDAFLMTFRRFLARRGRVSMMISDNGTNFTGTRNLLSSIDWDEVQRQSTILRIKWKLNAPTAAWWGGFFERMIRIIKNLLRRILGMSSVSYEEMETILCDCEAVINDRPLTYVEGDDVDALEPLKPSCFLHPLSNSDVTDLDIIDGISINKRMKYLQNLRNEFRQRFKREYLTTLIQRGKEKNQTLKVGDVVLVETEEKRIKWPLGIIVEMYTGRDGVDRTAKVKTSSGHRIRPCQRLYALELSFAEVEGRSESSGRASNSPIAKKYKLIVPSSTVTPEGGTNQQGPVTRFGRKVKLPSRYDF